MGRYGTTLFHLTSAVRNLRCTIGSTAFCTFTYGRCLSFLIPFAPSPCFARALLRVPSVAEHQDQSLKREERRCNCAPSKPRRNLLHGMAVFEGPDPDPHPAWGSDSQGPAVPMLIVTPQLLGLEPHALCHNCHHCHNYRFITPPSSALPPSNPSSPQQHARPPLLLPTSQQHVQNTGSRRNGRWGQCAGPRAAPRQRHPATLPCYARARPQEADV